MNKKLRIKFKLLTTGIGFSILTFSLPAFSTDRDEIAQKLSYAKKLQNGYEQNAKYLLDHNQGKRMFFDVAAWSSDEFDKLGDALSNGVKRAMDRQKKHSGFNDIQKKTMGLDPQPTLNHSPEALNLDFASVILKPNSPFSLSLKKLFAITYPDWTLRHLLDDVKAAKSKKDLLKIERDLENWKKNTFHQIWNENKNKPKILSDLVATQRATELWAVQSAYVLMLTSLEQKFQTPKESNPTAHKIAKSVTPQTEQSSKRGI